MAASSLLDENRQLQRAIALIGLGARLQVLQSETSLPYERLLRLYKEVAGRSPSKGQLPFSTEWFVSWQANVHASLFFNIYEYLQKASAIEQVEALMKAYELYCAESAAGSVEPMLSLTRAWRLVKFVDAGMLCLMRCVHCGGKFVNHARELEAGYVCGLCAPPARAGRGRAPRRDCVTRGESQPTRAQ